VISKTKEPAWQTFHKLTTPAVTSDKPAQITVDNDDEPESDFYPNADTTKSLATRTTALSDVEKSSIPSNDAPTPAAATAPDTTEGTIPDESSSESDTENLARLALYALACLKRLSRQSSPTPVLSGSKRLLHAIPSIQTTNTNVTHCCKLR
jgi:hypothetical protein